MNCVSHCSAHGCTAHASSEKLCDCDVHCRNHNDCCTETRSLDTLSSADLCNATHKQHHRHVAKAASSPASPKQTPCTRSTPYFHSQYARDQTLWRRQRRFLYYCADWGERNFAKYVKGGLPSAFIASILTERALILASCNRDQLDDEARGTDAYLADYVTFSSIRALDHTPTFSNLLASFINPCSCSRPLPPPAASRSHPV